MTWDVVVSVVFLLAVLLTMARCFYSTYKHHRQVADWSRGMDAERAEIVRLSNEGRTDEAIKLWEAHLKKHPPLP